MATSVLSIIEAQEWTELRNREIMTDGNHLPRTLLTLSVVDRRNPERHLSQIPHKFHQNTFSIS
jgi:hypothetical protein